MPSLTTAVLWIFFFFPGIEKQDKKTTGAGSSTDTSLSAIFRGEFRIQMTQSFLPVNGFFHTLE